MAAATRTLSQIDADIAATKAALKTVRGSETEVYARIVGYYRSVRNWNKGKRDEFNARTMFTVADGESYTVTEADSACACAQMTRVIQPEARGNIARYELFVRTTCPNCPPVKAYMADTAVAGVTIDVDTPAGFAKAAAHGVLSAPTVIVYDAADTEIARAHTVAELTTLFEPAIASQAV
ncbi:MAG: hypothetical protein IJ191_02680 [Treponema sp.]|nr:hypothetical protein [Treponema sp.]